MGEGKGEMGTGNGDGEGNGREMAHLAPLVWPHCYVAVSSACETGVHAGAEGGFALFAVAAAAVGDVEGEDDAVALFEEGDAAADFDDDAHIFVA